MDALSQFIAPLFPGWAASRIAAQAKLIAAQRYYEAVNISHHRTRRGGSQSADTVVDKSKGKLREYARWLDENHDLAVGVLDDLVVNIVGNGAGLEPLAQRSDGEPAPALNAQLRDLWESFWQRPTVDQSLSGADFERLICRTWLRDGEVFIQHVMGRSALRYPGSIPYLLEPLESDFVPFDLTTDTIVHGVQKNAWGQAIAYVVYKKHPGDLRGATSLETKNIPADQMLHLKFVRRLHQTRGVSIFHAVLPRLDDIKDYEESERIAARIAAAFTAYIKRNGEYETPLNDDGSRAFEMSPGMIYDNLLPGEDVGMIKSDRPNAGLENFRNGQLRAVAAGTGTRFSSISKNYNGTYSAQRQELVEGGLGYRRLFNTLLHHFYWPIWRTFIDAAILSGALRIPGGIDVSSVYRPEFRPPALPWIDPKKELDAFKTAVECGFKSRHQVIRDMGGDPSTVDQQLAADDFDYRPGQTTGPSAALADDTIQEEAA
jgi:lambda family phage portal protein